MPYTEVDKYSNIFVGPWGGESGTQWEYILNGDITRIDVTYDDDAIHSIKFTTKDGEGQIQESPVFGGKGSKTFELTINPEEEKLAVINGTIVMLNSIRVLKSFAFSTTKRRYIMVNGDPDQKFDFMYGQYRQPFTGFSGRCSTLLTAIGVILVNKINEEVQPAALGSNGGHVWKYNPSGVIYQITVKYDEKIHSITFTSQGTNGGALNSKRIGSGQGGTQTFTMVIDPLKERFIGVKGSYGLEGTGNRRMLSSLSFITNLPRSIGPFGTKTDDTFIQVVGQGINLTGFQGSIVGRTIDGIGISIQSTTSTRTVTAGLGTLIGMFGKRGLTIEKEYKIVGLLSRISLTYGDSVNSIQFESTDENGKEHTSNIFGQSNGLKKIDISLNIKGGEKLVGMSGTIGENSDKKIKSLTFTTSNKNEYGPFGKEVGSAFSVPLRGGLFSGFKFQMIGLDVKTIGVFVKPADP